MIIQGEAVVHVSLGQHSVLSVVFFFFLLMPKVLSPMEGAIVLTFAVFFSRSSWNV